MSAVTASPRHDGQGVGFHGHAQAEGGIVKLPLGKLRALARRLIDRILEKLILVK